MSFRVDRQGRACEAFSPIDEFCIGRHGVFYGFDVFSCGRKARYFAQFGVGNAKQKHSAIPLRMLF
jgi:hypothetical protein